MNQCLVNISCRGQCPTARGYFIGLKRVMNESDQGQSKWIWSNNFTWIQDAIEVRINTTHCPFSNNVCHCSATMRPMHTIPMLLFYVISEMMDKRFVHRCLS